MKNLIKSLKTALDNRARFVTTRNEIERMPLDVALDLGLYRGDAAKIAYKAVYH